MLGLMSLILGVVAPFSLAGLPHLPEAVANNAVVLVETKDGTYLLSFMGLGKGKTFKDVHNKAWRLKVGESAWKPISPVPSSLPLKGRLASIAVSVKGNVYLFGGYTVAEDHSEISSPDNYRYDVTTDIYHPIAKTPVPVDDAVALVYQQRFIYLISGWHNDGNVNLTQIYDIQTDSWQQASPFLGKPVFGHAGGIVEDSMVICDGVKVVALKDKRRNFAPEAACFKGQIDGKNPAKIDWRVIEHPTKTARYRMAATGDKDNNRIVFYGGSDNPYNYNGTGYNGAPAEPDGKIWLYDLEKQSWQLKNSGQLTMDHRGLIPVGKKFVVIGGMASGQTVTNKITSISLD